MHFYYVSSAESPTQVPPTIPIDSRAFLFGDHVYEVLRTYNKIPFAATPHYERMLASLQYLKHSIFPSFETFCQDLHTIGTYAKNVLHITDELYIRVHFGRLSDDRVSFRPASGIDPLWVYICAPIDWYTPSEHAQKNGYRMGVSTFKRHLPESFSPNAKTGNYLNNMIGFLDAMERGFDDAVFFSPRNHALCEGSNFNLAFFDTKGELVLMDPTDSPTYLKGVTQSYFASPACPLPWRYEAVTWDNIRQFPHAILLSTLRAFQWISTIENVPFARPPEHFTGPYVDYFHACVAKDTDAFSHVTSPQSAASGDTLTRVDSPPTC